MDGNRAGELTEANSPASDKAEYGPDCFGHDRVDHTGNHDCGDGIRERDERDCKQCPGPGRQIVQIGLHNAFL
jgi:hypothetical protein